MAIRIVGVNKSFGEFQALKDVSLDIPDGELTALLEHVREGFARLDAGELDAFELDELIHRYKRSTRELWKFCNLGRPETVAWMLENEGEIDWWAAGEPRRR